MPMRSFVARPLDRVSGISSPLGKICLYKGSIGKIFGNIFAQGLHKRRLGKMFGQDPYKSFLGKISARIDCNERSLKKIVALFIGSLYNITITGLLAEFFAQKFCKNSVGKISESRLFATF